MKIQTKIVGALLLAAFVVPGVSFAQTMSVAQLQAEIASLTAQLQALEAQLAAAGGSTAWCYTFNSNLSIGMSGAAVTALQTALQKDGESVQITGMFDDQTASAVTAFQEKYQTLILAPYGLSYGTGYAGKSTRAELNSLFGCTGSNPITPSQPIVPPVTIPTSTSSGSATINSFYAIPSIVNSGQATTLNFIATGSGLNQLKVILTCPAGTSATLGECSTPPTFAPNTNAYGLGLINTSGVSQQVVATLVGYDANNNPLVSQAIQMTVLPTTQTTPTTGASIAVTAPASGQAWAAGTTQQITWTSRNISGDYQIYLENTGVSGEGGLIQIANSLPNGTQSYNWAIPSTLTPGRYAIEVSAPSSAIVATGQTFTIAAANGLTPTANTFGISSMGGTSVVFTNSTQSLLGEFTITTPVATTLNSVLVKANGNVGSGQLSLANLRVVVTTQANAAQGLPPTQWYGATQALVSPNNTYAFSGSYPMAANTSAVIEVFGDTVSAAQGTYTSPISIAGATGVNTSVQSFTNVPGGNVYAEPPVTATFNASASTINSGNSVTFSWTGAAAPQGLMNDFITTSCVTGLTMYDATNNQSFICGDVSRPITASGSDTITFTNTTASPLSIQFELDYGSGQQLYQAVTVNPPLVSGTQGSLTLTSPNGGQTWHPGETHRITWNETGLQNVQIYLYNNAVTNSGGTNYITPNNASIPASQGYYDWTIPALTSLPTGASTNYRINLVGFPAGVTDPNAPGVLYSTDSTPFSIVAAPATTTATTYNGTVNVSVDPTTPAAGTVISPGSTGMIFAKLQLAASGGNANVQFLSVVSNSANAVNSLSNVRIYNGSTLLGTVSGLQPLASAAGGYANISLASPLILASGQSVTLTLVADVSSSATGTLDLGIGGGGGNFATMSPNYSVYGNNMTISTYGAAG